MQGELRSSLRVELNGLNFWVRTGSARAGGCVSMLWWKKCADGVNVDFNPNSGKLRGLVHRHPGQLGLGHVALEPGPGGRADDAAGRRRRPRLRRPRRADRVRDTRERRRRRQTDGLHAGEGRRAAGRRDPRPGPQRGDGDAAAAGGRARRACRERRRRSCSRSTRSPSTASCRARERPRCRAATCRRRRSRAPTWRGSRTPARRSPARSSSRACWSSRTAAAGCAGTPRPRRRRR